MNTKRPTFIQNIFILVSKIDNFYKYTCYLLKYIFKYHFS